MSGKRTHPPVIRLEKFEFMQGGDEELARYTRLAEDTLPYVGTLASVREPSPESAFFLLRDVKLRAALPLELDQRWQEWAKRYYEIRSRSPLLEMRDLIQGITERQEGLSWPFYATEDVLEEWIVAGDYDAPIESELYGAEYVTRPVFDRLRELRFITDGWIYDDGFKLRFARGAQWEQVKSELRSLRERKLDFR